MHEKILFIEDEPILRKNYKNLLEWGKEEYIVKTAENGEEALDKLDNFQPDLIICDYFMPGEYGDTLYQKLEEKSGGVPLLIFTAVSNYRSKHEVLFKPIAIEKIREKIEEMLKNKKLD